MKWKQLLFGIIIAIIAIYYFLILGVFTFQQQEEAQLFIFDWQNIETQLFVPGGFCHTVGQMIIQYYRYPPFAIAVQSFFIVVVTAFISRLLYNICPAGFHLPMAFIPVLYLLHESVQFSYLVDGTVGILLMVCILYFSTRVSGKKEIACYGIVSTVVLFCLSGELSVCYAVIYSFLTTLCFNDRKIHIYGLLCLLPALLFYLFYGYLNIPVSLSEGFKPAEYLETQQLPDYYIYRVWIIFSCYLLTVIVVARLLALWKSRSKMMNAFLSIIFVVVLLSQGLFYMPQQRDVKNYLMNELSYLAREEQWDAVIKHYQGKRITEYISLNYLNYALSKKGELAENMFSFDQHGSKGLIIPWTQTFFDSKLLCDIHFNIGDLSLAESYALDAMTQSQRGGSARMVQRLAQINLLKGEYSVADKYINLLRHAPVYSNWAERYSAYISDPPKMSDDAELKGKTFSPEKDDKLLLQIPIDSLWSCYGFDQKSGWEYAGCYYLAEKKMDEFKNFLLKSVKNTDIRLPRHFQEAWLMITATEELPIPSVFKIDPEIADRFRDFCKSDKAQILSNTGINSLYNAFGDTYWFYFYFKTSTKKEMK